jgi:Family of unknown function (DUF5681)
MTFVKGQSGNPAGRPPGIKNRSTLFAEALLEGEGEMIIRTAITQAREGDPAALRLCLDRLAPRLTPRACHVSFDIPRLESAADALAVLSRIAEAVGSGELAPDEADELSKPINRWIDALKAVDFEERLKKLEEERKRPSGDHEIVYGYKVEGSDELITR